MKIGTLGKFLCTLSVGVAFLLGVYVPAEAQRRDIPEWDSRTGRAYGQRVSWRRHRRNRLRRRLTRHQILERQRLQARLRRQRAQYGNSSDGQWRLSRKRQRAALKLHQRQEKSAFKQRWKNNRRRGH